MTADNQGTGAPEGDDPFAYLYRQEGGGTENGSATAPRPGVPRRSYNQVSAVGERQYGGQQYGQQYGGPAAAQAPPYGQGYGQDSPSAHYAAPETMPGGRAAMRQQGMGGGPDGRGRGGGGNRNGLLIAAVAVVAAVVIGIGTAMLFNSDETGDTAGGATGVTPTEGAGGGEEQDPGGKKSGDKGDGEKKNEKKNEKEGLPREDATALHFGGGATSASTVEGAKSRKGSYVTGMNAVGSSVTWTPKVKKAGTYDIYVRYSVPGKNMRMSLDVNGRPHATGLNMQNFAKAEKGDWAGGWTYTYATVQLDKGENSFTISCKKGDTCNALLDQVWLATPEARED